MEKNLRLKWQEYFEFPQSVIVPTKVRATLSSSHCKMLVQQAHLGLQCPENQRETHTTPILIPCTCRYNL
jgi:hypothetical protein